MSLVRLRYLRLLERSFRAAAALADAVRRLRDDPALARLVAARGLETYRSRASEAVLGAQWRRIVERAAIRAR